MLKLLLFSLSLLSVAWSRFPFAEEDNILLLGEPTWELSLKEVPEALIVYFSEPYSLECRRFWPDLLEVAKNLLDSGSKAQLSKIDCYGEEKLCQSLGATTYPTIRLYRENRRPFEYRGPKTAKALQEWIRKVVDFEYETIENEDDLFKRSSVAILVNTQLIDLNGAYKDLLDDVTIAKPGSGLKYKVGSSAGAIVTQGKKDVKIESGDSAETIKAKVNDLLHTEKAAVQNFNWETFQKLQGNDNHIFILFFRTNKFSLHSNITKLFDEAYRKHPANSVLFAYVNVPEDELGTRIGKYFGVTEDSDPTVGILVKQGKLLKKHKLEHPEAPGGFTHFWREFHAGSAKRYYMSAEIPVEDKSTIKELVTKNYKEVTQDPNHNVFVMLYYPWCEWCVKLEHTIKSLAYRTQDSDNVIIARIDVSQNDVEGYDKTEYPVFVLYPKGKDKKPIEYSSEKNIKSIKKFLFGHVPSLKEEIEL